MKTKIVYLLLGLLVGVALMLAAGAVVSDGRCGRYAMAPMQMEGGGSYPFVCFVVDTCTGRVERRSVGLCDALRQAAEARREANQWTEGLTFSELVDRIQEDLPVSEPVGDKWYKDDPIVTDR